MSGVLYILNKLHWHVHVYYHMLWLGLYNSLFVIFVIIGLNLMESIFNFNKPSGEKIVSFIAICVERLDFNFLRLVCGA